MLNSGRFDSSLANPQSEPDFFWNFGGDGLPSSSEMLAFCNVSLPVKRGRAAMLARRTSEKGLEGTVAM
jgi:hypothetical protein